MTFPRTKFISIYGPVKLENKFSAPKIQCWDRHKVTVRNTPIKEEKN